MDGWRGAIVLNWLGEWTCTDYGLPEQIPAEQRKLCWLHREWDALDQYRREMLRQEEIMRAVAADYGL